MPAICLGEGEGAAMGERASGAGRPGEVALAPAKPGFDAVAGKRLAGDSGDAVQFFRWDDSG